MSEELFDHKEEERRSQRKKEVQALAIKVIEEGGNPLVNTAEMLGVTDPILVVIADKLAGYKWRENASMLDNIFKDDDQVTRLKYVIDSLETILNDAEQGDLVRDIESVAIAHYSSEMDKKRLASAQ